MFPFHSEFFKVKGKGEEKKRRSDIGPVPCEEPAESEVVFKQAKCALHLDGAAQAQMDASGCGNTLLGQRPFFSKGLLQDDFLRLVQVLCPAALAAAGTTLAALAAVPGSGNELDPPVPVLIPFAEAACGPGNR